MKPENIGSMVGEFNFDLKGSVALGKYINQINSATLILYNADFHSIVAIESSRVLETEVSIDEYLYDSFYGYKTIGSRGATFRYTCGSETAIIMRGTSDLGKSKRTPHL